MKIKDTNYFSVQAWMVTKLKLKTVERDVFAIVYGYTQDGDSDFHGSLSYVSELTGYSKNSVCAAFAKLVDKKLLLKQEKQENHIKYCSYTINFDTVQSSCTGIQGSCTGIQGSLTNNKVDNKANKEKTLSKDKVEFDLNHSTKPKKPTLYDNCFNEILLFTKDESIRYDLVKYLKIRLKIQDKPLGLPGWKGLLKKLAKLPQKDWHAIIEQSVTNNWATFVELPDSNQPARKFNDYMVKNPTNKFENHELVTETF